MKKSNIQIIRFFKASCFDVNIKNLKVKDVENMETFFLFDEGFQC